MIQHIGWTPRKSGDPARPVELVYPDQGTSLERQHLQIGSIERLTGFWLVARLNRTAPQRQRHVPVQTDAVPQFVGILPHVEQLLPSAIGQEDIFPIRVTHHDLEETRPRISVVSKQVIARLLSPRNYAECVGPLPELRLAGGAGGDAEQIGQR